MVTLVVAVLDEGLDLALEVAKQEVVFEQDPVFRVWCQRLILPWICRCIGALRTRLICRASMYCANSPATTMPQPGSRSCYLPRVVILSLGSSTRPDLGLASK